MFALRKGAVMIGCLIGCLILARHDPGDLSLLSLSSFFFVSHRFVLLNSLTSEFLDGDNGTRETGQNGDDSQCDTDDDGSAPAWRRVMAHAGCGCRRVELGLSGRGGSCSGVELEDRCG
ncbi:hypothetical protein FB567DRAFT_535211 [Paraphoma chrysanthemicola]|uniref:Secreted protein n=1 Tax=Paraphoma chrysanthemicola TaxID=798071 RepID=A0A8K0QYC1_9PLEO|nr:hypothetical protein FB567DRAFT_535211 [Paraphoma chrysanthemicola]